MYWLIKRGKDFFRNLRMSVVNTVITEAETSNENRCGIEKKCENCENDKTSILVVGNHRACFKLWICDVHLMLPSPIQERAYIFRRRTVERVIVFGTITDVKEFKTRVLYEVDDGTGNINCVYDHDCMLSNRTKNIIDKYGGDRFEDNVEKRNDKTLSEPTVDNEESAAIKNSFNWLLKEVNRHKRKMKDIFDLGDTICVKGRIGEFFGRREIKVYQLHTIDNLKDETNHILEMVNLYESEYSKYL